MTPEQYEQVRGLFFAMEELDSSKRASFLEDAREKYEVNEVTNTTLIDTQFATKRRKQHRNSHVLMTLDLHLF